MDQTPSHSDERFRDAFHVSPVGNVIVRHGDGALVEINDACLRMLGYRRHELAGKGINALQFTPPLGLLADGASGSNPQHEVTFARRDGSQGHGLCFLHAMELQGEKHTLATLIDITERKEMEESLRESTMRLTATLEGGRMGTWSWDHAAGHMWWDDAATMLWGRLPGEAMPQPIETALQFVHADDRCRVAESFDRYLQTRVAQGIEFRTVRPDGALQWIAVRIGVQRPEWSEAGRLVGIFVDVTAEKRAEDAHVRSQKMEALATLAGGIAHDFNNILLAISGNTRLAMADLPQNHPVQHSLGEIDRASSRAADLVRRILTFSRHQEPRREVAALRPIVEEALRLIRPTVPGAIEIRTRLCDEAPPVALDAVQIHQIVTNLATNATHAIEPRAGLIEVTLERATLDAQSLEGLPPGDYARLTLRDDGAGMDAATLERIFDPFFTTKPIGKATGLGLSVVHGIVQNLGGAIVVDSAPGTGTKFEIYFPAANAAARPAQIEKSGPLRGEGQRVLYVDDEEALVFLVTRVLERLGYSVLGFTDPAKALAAIRHDPSGIDVVVTDLSMHTMSGFDLARAALAARADLPVLLTSGYVRAEDRETARQCGIREVILKPNTVEELGHALNRLFVDWNVAQPAR